jgi:HKD family nuclease
MSVYSGEKASKLLMDLIKNAKQSIWVATDSLDEFGADLLVEAAIRGVKVRLLVPEGVDYEILRRLSIEGVEVRIYRSKFLHAKSIIVDGFAYVGSANLTANALKARNIELVIETDAKRATELINEFEKWWNEAEDIDLATYARASEKFVYFKISKKIINSNEVVSIRFTREPVYIEMLNPFTLNGGLTISGRGGSISFRYVFISLLGPAFLVFYNAATNQRRRALYASLEYKAHEIIRDNHSFFSPYVGNLAALRALGSIGGSLSHFHKLIENLIGSSDFIDLRNKLSEDLLIHVKKFLVDNNLMSQDAKISVGEEKDPSTTLFFIDLRDLAYIHEVSISLEYSVEDIQEKSIHLRSKYYVEKEIKRKFDSYLKDLVKTLDLENYKRLVEGRIFNKLKMAIKNLRDHGFEKFYIPIIIRCSIKLSRGITVSSEDISLMELSYSV